MYSVSRKNCENTAPLEETETVDTAPVLEAA
jgi:hypothetical protein